MQTNKYEVIGIVGEGAYGIVYKCKNKETGEFVAIKKFKENEDEIVKKTMKRELRVLQMLKHENIVDFREAFKRKGNLFLVFEYVDKNLLELLQEHPNGLDPQIIKSLIYQLCKAIKYLHDQNIIHRDIKPENLLVDNHMKLKLCDFGFARAIKNTVENMTDYVATRWYRSPELLITSGVYGPEIDHWAIGCIMGELADGIPLFPGENETDQLHSIQKVMGNLPEEQVVMFYKNPIYKGKSLLDVQKPESLERRYMGKLSKLAISFMKGLLNVDPKLRLKGDSVFHHPYFENYGDIKPNVNANVNATHANENLNLQAIKVTKVSNISLLPVSNTVISSKPCENIAAINNPVAINTTNINIINYNNFEGYPHIDDNKKLTVVKLNSTPNITKEDKNTYTTPLIIANPNYKMNFKKKSSDKNLDPLGLIVQNKNFNLTMKQGFGNFNNAQDSHLFTSVNFNKNLKDNNMNLINLIPKTNLDADYKTFNKFKGGDKYNFEIDMQNYHDGNNNPIPNYVSTKSIASQMGHSIINEQIELAIEAKKKSKSLNSLVKGNTSNQKVSEPVGVKVFPFNGDMYGYNFMNNHKSPSLALKHLNFIPGNYSQGGMNNINIPTTGGKHIHLPAITRGINGNANSKVNLKKFNQLINK